MGNDMYNDEQLAHAKAMSLKNNPRIGHSPSTVDEALSWLNRMAHGEPEMHLVSLRAAVDLVRRELFATRVNRDEWRRHAEERLADVLRLRSLGIEFASQYGDRSLACNYDNSCDDSGREPECIPCAFRRALGLMGVN